MSQWKAKTLLILLRCGVYAQRFLFFVGRQLGGVVAKGIVFIQKTFWLKAYASWFRFYKKHLSATVGGTSWFFDIIVRRHILEVVLLSMGLLLVVPESVFSKPKPGLPWKDTPLFTLVGLSDEMGETEEVLLDFNELAKGDTLPAWKQGTVQQVTVSNSGEEVSLYTPADSLAHTARGVAVIKPIIQPSSVGTTPAVVSTGRLETIQYTVQSGDVLGKIAADFGISIETLLWANNLTLRSYIRPGDTLKILPVSGVTHVIKRGDTVSKIASLYGADQKAIITANGLNENGTNLIIGKELIIPGGQRATTAVVSRPATSVTTPARTVAAPPSDEAPSGSGYLWPTAVRRITTFYGQYYKFGVHTGVDIAGPKGTPIYATRAGTVIVSKCETTGYGCHIVLDHGDGVSSLYGHASVLRVSVGDYVDQGQTIADMGSTGLSTGPHLHFEIKINGARTNPLKYVR